MSTLSQRLQQFVDHEGLTLYQANRAAGLSTGILIKAAQGTGLSAASLARLLLAFPQLNADWLLTGRGQMLLADDARPAPPSPDPLPPDLDASLYRCIIWHILLQDTYADTLDRLDDCIALVKKSGGQLATLDGQLQRLRQMIVTNHDFQPQDHGLYEISLRIAAGDDGRYTPAQLKSDLDLPRRLVRHLGLETT